MKLIRLIALVSLVLLAFAANSLLCRWALLLFDYSPISFTLVRLASGALTLLALLTFLSSSKGKGLLPLVSFRFWLLGFSLFVYALMFSLAYVKLDAGVGAFILFASVQLTLLVLGRLMGNQLSKQQWIGAFLAIIGLALLLLPDGHSSTDLSYGLLMLCGALAWAGFVILGKGSDSPLVDVSSAFVSATTLMMLLFIYLVVNSHVNTELLWFSPAFLLAVLSGSMMSGLAYYLWYRVLPIIGIEHAAQLQLLVPVLAVMMGAYVLNERLSLVMWCGCGVIVIGVWLFLNDRKTKLT